MSLEQAPPPNDTDKGWKPDPLGVGEQRWWDGEKWGTQVTKPKKEKMGASKKWLIGIGIGIVVLIGIGAIAGDDDKDTSSTKNEKVAASRATEKPVSNSAPEPAAEEPEMTPGQENALGAAENYLSFAPFSKAGLIDQLSSSAGDGFSKADATFAANRVDANWNEEAYEAAKNYLDISSFSLSGLIDQLTSSAGDQFTQAQAEYGAERAYNGE